MTDVITCPGCGRRLVLPAGVEADFLSCPKCLAQIPNPRQRDAPATAGIQTGPTAPRWEPHRLRSASLDDEVQGDTRKATGCIGLLAVLGGVGSFLVLATWLKFAGSEPGAVSESLVALFSVLAVAAVVAIVQLARGKTPTAGNVVVGTLATFGGLILVWFAFLIFLFLVCLVNPPRFH
jgi:hypothetical protein